MTIIVKRKSVEFLMHLMKVFRTNIGLNFVYAEANVICTSETIPCSPFLSSICPTAWKSVFELATGKRSSQGLTKNILYWLEYKN